MTVWVSGVCVGEVFYSSITDTYSSITDKTGKFSTFHFQFSIFKQMSRQAQHDRIADKIGERLFGPAVAVILYIFLLFMQKMS
jgi:hypothetical protein